MKIRYIAALQPLLVAALVSSSFALDVQLGDVKDNRTTGQYFGGLEVELKLIGDGLNDATALRTTVSSALDSTGQSLIKKEDQSEGFEELSRYGGEVNNSFTLKFRNPSRKADKLTELKGEIELFVPKNDPQSIVSIDGLANWTGKPLTDPALKAAGIEVKLLTSEQQVAVRKAEQAERLAELKKQGVGEAMIKMAEESFDMFGGGDANSIMSQIKDPNNKLIGVSFWNAQGEEIRNNGSMSSGDEKTFYFNEKLPADTKLKVYVLSDKSVVKVPIQLANLTLP